MPSRFARWSTLVLFAILCACGGGGGDASTPASASDDARFATLAAVEGFSSTLDRANVDAANQKMLAFLKARTEFADAGISEDR